MQRYQIDRWADFYTDSFRPAFTKYIGAIFAKEKDRPFDERDKLIMDRATEQQKKVLEKVQKKLAEGTKFITGDSMSFADHAIFCEMQDCKYIGHDISAYPGLIKYQEDVMAASPGINEIHKEGGAWHSMLPAIQAFMKVEFPQ